MRNEVAHGPKVLRKEDLQPKVGVVFGTRPGIIKMSPLFGVLESRKIDHFSIHTGQHFSYEMDRQIFEDLNLGTPKYKLDTGQKCYFHGEQTAEMIVGIEKALLIEKPRVILVCGDANTCLSAALAARKLNIEIGHVESGLRSNDWRMPEEHNRVMVDHISEYLFAPSEQARQNLIKDNVLGKIVVTGNTVVDALMSHISLALDRSSILNNLELTPKEYIVITAHREENVDDKENLTNLLDALERVAAKFGLRIVFPVHPRTTMRLEQFGLQERAQSIKGLKIITPVGYLDFLSLMSNARIMLTDSGGIQEEACILKVPCVTLRENTERPETVEVGANIIAGTDPTVIVESTAEMLKREGDWANPYGDGTASTQIIDTVTRGF